MVTPVIARPKPFLVTLEAEHTYFWCACGRSASQPFCDGSHLGTGITPHKFVALRTQEALLCGCKQTSVGPFCDGAPTPTCRAARRPMILTAPPTARFQSLRNAMVPGDGSTAGATSKAAPHRHLYEEAIIVLAGEGYMWTEQRKARVQAGGAIFLPRKQLHSLEATSPEGIFVVGVICPGDNPSIAYYD